MSDLSRTREARRALRTFLKSRALTGEPARGPVISRRFSSRPGQGVVELTESDLRELLRAEQTARRAAAHLQRKNTVYVQRLKDWDALSPATLSRWKALQNTAAVQSQKAAEVVEKYRAAQAEAVRRGTAVDELRTENTSLRSTVADLSRKIQDPPGSHERWQELRDSLQTSLAQAEKKNREQWDRVRAELADANRQNAELAQELQDAKKTAASTQQALSNLRASRKEAPVTEQTWKVLLAERDRLQAENALIPVLQEELQALRTANAPRTYADLLSDPDEVAAEALRKLAEVLALFAPRPKDKM